MLREIIARDVHYKPSMILCVRARKIALAALIGDYMEQFSIVRDNGYEVYKHNVGSTVILGVEDDGGQNVEHVF